ncbi:hemin-degrading factor [Ichthyobacterium seriolicida]|uniref:Heme ABC transporter n=1 Tax=Ichthyobacterium seriolicida TaxID=242600 RepID=A0A1J1EB56_9FLAO|nr:ChuX/HutX family heme-like substrate-binding protein [Ichthyobacterium seriolicida]BAV94752.1 heme ABC transporter [Ichthyobacterium seriolicida]
MDDITIKPNLKERWETFRNLNPNKRIKDAAQELGVSELELLVTECGNSVIRLQPKFKEILMEIKSLGKVMALTRNEYCVHEVKGEYKNPIFKDDNLGLFLGEIDLRFFLNHWHSVFSVHDNMKGKDLYSFQFFSSTGKALHKIYLMPESNIDNYHNLVNKFKDENQEDYEIVTKVEKNPKNDLDDPKIDLEQFHREWKEMQDTHEFMSICRKHKLNKIQAFNLAPSEHYAKKIPNSAVVEVIQEVASKSIPVMIFVTNPGNIQIYTGEIEKTSFHNEWFNVLDSDFNLHLNADKISQAWVVRRPSGKDGEVSALEVFDEDENLIVQLFGKRKEGSPELQSWKELLMKYTK